MKQMVFQEINFLKDHLFFESSVYAPDLSIHNHFRKKKLPGCDTFLYQVYS